jgi:hypothetical protein
MLYQLALITNLGVITPLATFQDQGACLREAAFIQKTNQYSVACLPTNSPEQLQKQIQDSMRMMMETLNNIAKEQK